LFSKGAILKNEKCNIIFKNKKKKEVFLAAALRKERHERERWKGSVFFSSFFFVARALVASLFLSFVHSLAFFSFFLSFFRFLLFHLLQKKPLLFPSTMPLKPRAKAKRAKPAAAVSLFLEC